MPIWSMPSSAIGNSLDLSLSKSNNILVNSLALLAFTNSSEVYKVNKERLDFEALSNWLIEQQNELKQFENTIDNYFGCRALYNYFRLQDSYSYDARIHGNISSPNFTTIRHFNAKDLPFILNVPSHTQILNLKTKGDGRLLLGVQLITERRKRGKRDPSSIYPVSIYLNQGRDPETKKIIQTVEIISHSVMLNSLQIEHGLFTGFTSTPDLVILQDDQTKFLIEPKISATAIHFVLKNLDKDRSVKYTVTLIEPTTNYSPQNLAPIAISAIRHAVMGRLIVLPSSLSFTAMLTPHQPNQNMAQHPIDLWQRKRRQVDSIFTHPQHRRRLHRNHHQLDDDENENPLQIPYKPAPFGNRLFSSDMKIPKLGTVSLITDEPPQISVQSGDDGPSTEFHDYVEADEHQITRVTIPERSENNGGASGNPTKRRVDMNPGNHGANGAMVSEMLQPNLQTSSAELVETVCLANGACTCAEVTCSLKCTNCSQLSFQSMCDELNNSGRFSLIFRILSTNQVKVNDAEYNVFDVRIIDWFSNQVLAPDQLSIWLRKCNGACIRMTSTLANAKNPRFLLIGNSLGLFDGTNNLNGEVAEVPETIEDSKRSTRKVVRSVMRTHYVMRDEDRLAKSTDCWPLFGRLQDEQC